MIANRISWGMASRSDMLFAEIEVLSSWAPINGGAVEEELSGSIMATKPQSREMKIVMRGEDDSSEWGRQLLGRFLFASPFWRLGGGSSSD